MPSFEARQPVVDSVPTAVHVVQVHSVCNGGVRGLVFQVQAWPGPQALAQLEGEVEMLLLSLAALQRYCKSIGTAKTTRKLLFATPEALGI